MTACGRVRVRVRVRVRLRLRLRLRVGLEGWRLEAGRGRLEIHILEEGLSSGAARELVAAGQHRQQGRGEGGAVANVFIVAPFIVDVYVLALVCVQQRALNERHLVKVRVGVRFGVRVRVRVRMSGTVMSCTTVSTIGRTVAHSPRLSRMLPCESTVSSSWLTWEPPVSLPPNRL